MKGSIVVLFILSCLVLLAVQTVPAQSQTVAGAQGVLGTTAISSPTFSVQGVLRDPNGRSVDDATYTLTFKLYTVASGGTEVWSETITNVAVSHGIFAVKLGAVTPLTSLNFTDQYFLGITVQGSSEMAPRIELVKSPSALAVVGASNILPSIGKAGIGTLTPGAKLEVKNDTGAVALNVTNSSGVSQVFVGNNGNVGISNPTPGSRLTVAGPGTTSSTSGLNVTNSSGSTTLFVRDDNRVGIGTNNPADKLEVNGNIRITPGSGNSIIFSDGSSLNSAVLGGSARTVSDTGNVTITSDGNANGVGNLSFITGTTEKMRVQVTGNVGINTGSINPATNPLAKLHVYTTTNGDGILVDGNASPGVRLANAEVEKGAFGLATGAGAWSTDAATNDVVLRSASGQKVRINANGGTGAASLVVSSSGVEITGAVTANGTASAANRVLSTNGSGTLTWQNNGVPIGVICMWSGTNANIPAGWALCDGSTVSGQVTPDLRNRFIIGSGSTYTTGNTGGASTVTLAVTNLPPHTHTGTTSTDGSHTHTWNHGLEQDDSGTGGSYNEYTQIGGSDAGVIGAAGSHSHTVTTNATTGANSTAFSILPPYYALAFIMHVSN